MSTVLSFACRPLWHCIPASIPTKGFLTLLTNMDVHKGLLCTHDQPGQRRLSQVPTIYCTGFKNSPLGLFTRYNGQRGGSTIIRGYYNRLGTYKQHCEQVHVSSPLSAQVLWTLCAFYTVLCYLVQTENWLARPLVNVFFQSSNPMSNSATKGLQKTGREVRCALLSPTVSHLY